ncbi:MAG: threonine ammonia-lyase, biosynthetic [Arenicella sp.]
MDKELLEKVDNAQVYDVAVKTPLDFAPKISERIGNQIWLKREDLQPVFSFKIRGAYNCIMNLTQEQRQKGVIAASAGNHAQGVAFSAKKLGIPATIVMPETTPNIKVDAVRSAGAEVVLHGLSYSDAAERADEIVAQRGMTYIHPFDNLNVIAGQGTVGKEILEQLDSVEVIFVCVGGGGLLAGIASYVKQMRPDIKVIGVEPDDSDAMTQSIAQEHRVELPEVGIFADGVAVKQVGEETYRLCKQYVDDMIVVSTDQICAAIKDVFEDTRTVLEPAGAVGLAGAKMYCQQQQWQDKVIAVTASGANMNFDRLRHVSERTQFAERREGVIAVKIPEQPGSFRAFCDAIGDFNITEFNYRYADSRQAIIYVGVEIKDAGQLDRLITKLRDQDYETTDLTDNEVAKLHVRHLVGGRCQGVEDEVLYRFQFPERPGALLSFLQKLGGNWNISLFHYRNHGADFGRVLCGLQVPDTQKADFAQALQELGYQYVDETDNPAYQLFLA